LLLEVVTCFSESTKQPFLPPCNILGWIAGIWHADIFHAGACTGKSRLQGCSQQPQHQPAHQLAHSLQPARFCYSKEDALLPLIRLFLGVFSVFFFLVIFAVVKCT
jgi:hypothetical protein